MDKLSSRYCPQGPRLILRHSLLQCFPYGDVAQSVEQGIHKPWVTGSSPVVAIQARTKRFRAFFVRVQRPPSRSCPANRAGPPRLPAHALRMTPAYPACPRPISQCSPCPLIASPLAPYCPHSQHHPKQKTRTFLHGFASQSCSPSPNSPPPQPAKSSFQSEVCRPMRRGLFHRRGCRSIANLVSRLPTRTPATCKTLPPPFPSPRVCRLVR